MKRDIKILSILILAAVVYFGLKYKTRRTSEQRIEEMLSETRKSFASDVVLFDRNYLGLQIDTLISKGKYAEALEVVDSSNIARNLKLDYKGQILLKQGKFRESITLFNQAIALTKGFAKAISNRAKAYSLLKLYDSAIIDYKGIAEFNSDYNRPLAETYELMQEKDSALKYYNLFLTSYPDSASVKTRIRSLENGG